MRIRSALTLSALCVLLLNRPANAAPADAGRFLGQGAGLFQAMVANADDSDGRNVTSSSVSDGNDRDRYVAGVALGFGLLTYFLVGSNNRDVIIDQPSDNTPGGILPPHNDGGTIQPNLPVPDVLTDGTVTPEPATFLLLGTGLSSLPLVARRRRRIRS